MKHTKEPWSDVNLDVIGGTPRIRIADCYVTRAGFDGGLNAANAKRIVDCVNACEGIDDPQEAITAIKNALAECEYCLNMQNYKDRIRCITIARQALQKVSK